MGEEDKKQEKAPVEEPLNLDIEMPTPEEKEEDIPTVSQEPEIPTYEVEMPADPPQRETQAPRTGRRRYWLIGLGIAAGLAIAGDIYLQKPEIKVGYEPSKGYVQLYNDHKQKGVDLYNQGVAEVKKVNTDYIKLEERINKTKEVGKYNEHKGLYHFGVGAAAGALAVYLIMRRRRED